MLALGTVASLLAKIIYGVESVGRDGRVRPFRKPLFEVFSMFLGMALCVVLDWWTRDAALELEWRQYQEAAAAAEAVDVVCKVVAAEHLAAHHHPAGVAGPGGDRAHVHRPAVRAGFGVSDAARQYVSVLCGVLGDAAAPPPALLQLSRGVDGAGGHQSGGVGVDSERAGRHRPGGAGAGYGADGRRTGSTGTASGGRGAPATEPAIAGDAGGVVRGLVRHGAVRVGALSAGVPAARLRPGRALGGRGGFGGDDCALGRAGGDPGGGRGLDALLQPVQFERDPVEFGHVPHHSGDDAHVVAGFVAIVAGTFTYGKQPVDIGPVAEEVAAVKEEEEAEAERDTEAKLAPPNYGAVAPRAAAAAAAPPPQTPEPIDEEAAPAYENARPVMPVTATPHSYGTSPAFFMRHGGISPAVYVGSPLPFGGSMRLAEPRNRLRRRRSSHLSVDSSHSGSNDHATERRRLDSAEPQPE
eukprot:ctg_144.g145